jgi:hypothetical protein
VPAAQPVGIVKPGLFLVPRDLLVRTEGPMDGETRAVGSRVVKKD